MAGNSDEISEKLDTKSPFPYLSVNNLAWPECPPMTFKEMNAAVMLLGAAVISAWC